MLGILSRLYVWLTVFNTGRETEFMEVNFGDFWGIKWRSVLNNKLDAELLNWDSLRLEFWLKKKMLIMSVGSEGKDPNR